ncbi:MAG: YaeQ family protein [Myxococcales bacterium]|nr:YaeQ family protein [Myxococcales bacterium]
MARRGARSPERIHKASKLADEVVIYTHRDLDRVVDELSGKGVHQAENIRVVGVPTELLDALEARLDRNMAWGLLRTEGALYVSGEGWSVEGALTERRLS